MNEILNRLALVSPYFSELEEVPAPGRAPDRPSKDDDDDTDDEDEDFDDDDYEEGGPLTEVPTTQDPLMVLR